MARLHRRLPDQEKYPLPPREITNSLVRKTDATPLSTRSRTLLTWLAHFGYGGAAGAVYPLVRRHMTDSPVGRGLIFGMGVWAVSYLGLLPGLDILKPVTQQPVRRSALMIIAHLVWGCILAVVFEILIGDESRKATAFHHSGKESVDEA